MSELDYPFEETLIAFEKGEVGHDDVLADFAKRMKRQQAKGGLEVLDALEVRWAEGVFVCHEVERLGDSKCSPRCRRCALDAERERLEATVGERNRNG